MSPLHIAPPGPPQNFVAQVESDTEIDLSWDSLMISNQAAYEICWNALTPVCVDGPVSVILAELDIKLLIPYGAKILWGEILTDWLHSEV